MKRPRAPTLELRRPDGTSTYTTLEEFPFRVGRSESQHLQLRGTLISRSHCHFTLASGEDRDGGNRDGSGLCVEDSGSSNGSWVERTLPTGETTRSRLSTSTPHHLRDGDRVMLGGEKPMLGGAVLYFHAAQAEAMAKRGA